MSLGFVMLCHTALDRAAQVARYWATRDCPVVIHADKRTRRAGRKACAPIWPIWTTSGSRPPCLRMGTWGIVAATQTASLMMLREFPQVRHVYLALHRFLPAPAPGRGDAGLYLDDRPRTDSSA